MTESYLTKFAEDFSVAVDALRNIEEKRERCAPGTSEAEAGEEASLTTREILRRGMADTRRLPVHAANLSDRWAILSLCVEAFGLADPDVASLAGIFAVEAGLAAQAEALEQAG